MIAFSRQVKGTDAQLVFQNFMDEQAGHSSATADAHYAMSSHDLKEISTGRINRFLLASSAWHQLLGIDTDFRRADVQSGPVVRTVEGSSEVLNEIAALKTLFLSKWVVMDDLRVRLDMALLQGGMASIDQGLLDYEESQVALAHTAIVRRAASFDYSDVFSRQIQIDVGMQLLMGTTFFKSPEQKRGCLAVLERRESVCGIIPTGGGKTLWFLLAAHLERTMVTVVVVPLVALMRQHLLTAIQCTVPAIEWKRTDDIHADDLPCLVFTSAECAGSREGIELMEKLEATGRLSRIVFDEAHTLVDWTWRESIVRLRQIRKFAVPLLLLSATIPNYTESVYKRIFKREFKFIRSLTVRRDVSLSVKHLSHMYSERHPNPRQVAIDTICEKLQELHSDDRIIVYCMFTADLRAVMRMVDESIENERATGYFSGMTDEEKDASRERWTSGECRVMVATTAFALGVDYPSVRLVILYGGAYSVSDMVQSVGRLGRDGRGGHASVIVSYQLLGRVRRQIVREKGQEEYSLLQSFVKPGTCRQWLLGLVMDGVDWTCFDDDTASWKKCDSCMMRTLTDQEGSRSADVHTLVSLITVRSLFPLITAFYIVS